jgi:hypothetical protein
MSIVKPALALATFGIATSSASAAVLVADTYVQRQDITDTTPPSSDRNDDTIKLRVGGTGGAVDDDRVGLVRFGVNEVGPSVGSSLTLTVSNSPRSASAADPLTLRLYGVNNGLYEDTFTENTGSNPFTTYDPSANGGMGDFVIDALDTSGNLVGEGNVFSNGPLETLQIESNLTQGDVITIIGASLDAFISTATTTADDDLTFILTLAGSARSADQSLEFFSSNTPGNSSVPDSPPTLNVVVPEPSSALMGGVMGLALLGRRYRR